MTIIKPIMILGIGYLFSLVLSDLFIYLKGTLISNVTKIEKKTLYHFGILLGSIIASLLYLDDKDIYLGLQIGLFLSVGFGLLLIVIKSLIRFSDFFPVKKQIVNSINSKGFKISNGKKVKQFYWREIRNLRFDKARFNLEITDKRKIVLNEKTQNLYLLLKSIPFGFKDFDYAFRDFFFSNLKTCVVCGAIAFKDSKCLSCGSTTWTEELEKDYSNYDEYVKTNQLEIFATMERNEKFCDFKIIDKNFDFDNTWSPKVTKKEVLEFSEKEYWNIK